MPARLHGADAGAGGGRPRTRLPPPLRARLPRLRARPRGARGVSRHGYRLPGADVDLAALRLSLAPRRAHHRARSSSSGSRSRTGSATSAGAGGSWSRRSSRSRSSCRPRCSASTCSSAFSPRSPLGRAFDGRHRATRSLLLRGAPRGLGPVQPPLRGPALRRGARGGSTRASSRRPTPWASRGSRTFFRVSLPLAWHGVLAGAVLAFAHTLGEFGVVLMVGGNIAGGDADALHRDLRLTSSSSTTPPPSRTVAPPPRASPSRCWSSSYALQRRSPAWPMAPSADLRPRAALPGRPVGPRAALRLPLDGGAGDGPLRPIGRGQDDRAARLAGLDRPDAGTIRFDGETWFDATSGGASSPQRRGSGSSSRSTRSSRTSRSPRTSATGCAAPRARSAGGAGPARWRGAAPARSSSWRAARPALRRRAPAGRARARARAAAAPAPPRRAALGARRAHARGAARRAARASLEATGVPCLVVTHDRVEALALGDRMAVLADGAVRQVGPVHEVFSAPADLAVARVVGTENVARGAPPRAARRPRAGARSGRRGSSRSTRAASTARPTPASAPRTWCSSRRPPPPPAPGTSSPASVRARRRRGRSSA